MKVTGKLSVTPAGVSEKTGRAFESFATFVGVSPAAADKAIEFTINGDSALLEELQKVAHMAQAKSAHLVVEVTGGVVNTTAEMTNDGGVRRPRTWALGKPVHRLVGEASWKIVGAERIPTATPEGDFTADAASALAAL